MKVPAHKRYRNEIKKRQPKMSFDKSFRRFTAIAAGAAVGVAGYYGLKGLFGSNEKKKKHKTTDLKLGKYDYKITSYK